MDLITAKKAFNDQLKAFFVLEATNWTESAHIYM